MRASGGPPAAALAVVLGFVLLAGGCQGQAGGGGVPSSQVPDAGGSDGPGGPSTPTTGSGPPRGTAPPAAATPVPVRLRGTLRAGVEPGCLLLEAERGGHYLLLGEQVPRLPAGTEVEVRGVVEHVRTTCQQGRPLRVISARER